ncbi:MAG: phosphoribosylanthranilate isomerase [Spartobacteria bacterium]|nr:phosphoribosylanthranilate isomerase [Spartobacteria bacterium]
METGLQMKICGITRLEDALKAAELGVNYLGFIFVPQSPRCVDAAFAQEVRARLPVSVKTVGVFMDQPLDYVQRTADVCDFDVLQLHGDEPSSWVSQLDGRTIWKAVHLQCDADVVAISVYPADALLVDAMSGQQRGGTGKVADWSLAATLSARRRVVLAGGLSVENMASALQTVKPYAVDINSRIEDAPGKKNHEKMEQILAICRAQALEARTKTKENDHV